MIGQACIGLRSLLAARVNEAICTQCKIPRNFHPHSTPAIPSLHTFVSGSASALVTYSRSKAAPPSPATVQRIQPSFRALRFSLFPPVCSQIP